MNMKGGWSDQSREAGRGGNGRDEVSHKDEPTPHHAGEEADDHDVYDMAKQKEQRCIPHIVMLEKKKMAVGDRRYQQWEFGFLHGRRREDPIELARCRGYPLPRQCIAVVARMTGVMSSSSLGGASLGVSIGGVADVAYTAGGVSSVPRCTGRWCTGN